MPESHLPESVVLAFDGMGRGLMGCSSEACDALERCGPHAASAVEAQRVVSVQQECLVTKGFTANEAASGTVM